MNDINAFTPIKRFFEKKKTFKTIIFSSLLLSYLTMFHHSILYEDVVLALFLTGIGLYTSGVTFITLLQMNLVWKLMLTITGPVTSSLADYAVNGFLNSMSVSYTYAIWYGGMTLLYLLLHWVVWGINGNVVYVFMPNLNYFIFYKNGSEYSFSFSNPVIAWRDTQINMQASENYRREE